MKNIIRFLFILVVCGSLGKLSIAQGTLGEYPGAGVGFDSTCGYADAGNSDPGVADAGLTGNVCGSTFDVSFGTWTETATGFDITGFELNNYDIDEEAAYGIRLFYGPQDNCCTICLDAMIDLTQGSGCGTFGPQANLSSFGYPIPANYGGDIFGEDVIPYSDMCPNTEYFAQYNFILATAVDLTDPDGNFCAMDDALITNAGTQTTVQTLVAPGTRDGLTINAATFTPVAATDCASTDVLFDIVVDVTSGCAVDFGVCSKGLEIELRASLACADGTTLDIATGPLVNDPTNCFVGIAGTNELAGQISLGTAADICAIFACDPNASLEVYARHTFCEADDIAGDGSGIDEAVFSIDIASIVADFNTSMCCAEPVCEPFNAVVVAPFCDGYQVCMGYTDDLGLDPTGATVTVSDDSGLTGTVLDDGMTTVLTFDADGDGTDDSSGYCYTVALTNETCGPVSYTPLITATCTDGTPATYANGATLTNYDYLDGIFGVTGGTAAYPNIVGLITAPVCPIMLDESDAVAGFVEIFPADANGDPIAGAAACTTITGETPACETAGGDAATIVQWNPISDPLLTAAGAAEYACGLDGTADLSFNCTGCATPDCMGVVDYPDVELCNAASDGTGTAAVFTPITCSVNPEINNGDGTLTLISLDIYAPDASDPMNNYLGSLFESATFGLSACDPLTITLPDNLSCDGLLYQFEIVTAINTVNEADGMVIDFVNDASCASEIMTAIQYPVLTASATDATCPDDIVANLTAEDGTVCLTEMQACAADGPVDFDFSGSFTDPLACSTLTATASCSNCGAVCDLAISVSQVSCDNAGTPDDTSDDVITYSVTATGGPGATWSGTDTNGETYTNVSYGTPFTSTMPLMGPGSVTVTVIDDTDGTCTLDATVPFDGCNLPAIPTLSQWGLMSLALLLMIFGALKLDSATVASYKLRRN